ncbi:hypothetical protein [Deinococcus sp. PEB2-63]
MLTSLDLYLTGDLNDAQRHLLAYDWAFAGPRPATRPVSVRTGPLPAAPDGPTQAVALPDRVIPVQRRGDDLWLNAELHLRLLTGGAELTVPHAGAARDVWALALTELHRAAGWLPLHAALIGTPTHAVLIGGPSGAGKSTACLRLRAAGLTVHAEDRAWAHPDGHALGMDRTLRAYRDSLDRFAPHLLPAAATAPRDPRGKIVLPLQPQPPVTLRGVLLLGEGGPLSTPERVRHAWELTGVPLTAAGRAAATHSVQALLRAPWRRTTRGQLEDDLRATLRG